MKSCFTDAVSPESRPSGVSKGDCHGDIHPWQVLHLCRSVRNLAPVIEVQLAAGMRPMAMTLEGPVEPAQWLAKSAHKDARATSLFSAWREVRVWRQHIARNREAVEIFHAHEFPAGMAGIRVGAPLVYDIHGFVEERAANVAARSWLARSFRTAEQFVFSRAGAVVVHSSEAYRAALRRGATTANLFLIPEPRPLLDAELEPVWLRTLAEKYHAVYAYVFHQRHTGHGTLLPPGWQPLAACF